MTIAQAYAIARDRRHCRRDVVVDHAEAQAIGNEQYHIMWLRGLCLSAGGRNRDDLGDGCLQNCSDEGECQAHDRLHAEAGNVPFWRSRMTTI